MQNRFLIIAIIIVTLSFIHSSFVDAAQEEKATTKLEAFLAKKGEIIIKEFYAVGSTQGIYGTITKITALIIYKPGLKQEATKGLRIEMKKTGRYEKEAKAFLDIEEVESLSKAIVYMMDLAGEWTNTNREYTEVIFATTGDFNIGFYQKEAKQSAFFRAGRINEVTAFMPEVISLLNIKDIVDKGLELLRTK